MKVDEQKMIVEIRKLRDELSNVNFQICKQTVTSFNIMKKRKGEK